MIESSNNPSVLCQLIAEKITTTSEQRITFAEYMNLALYHPQHGYYATKAIKIGGQGDFFTSPHLGADFGELLAEQFWQMWVILGSPSKFTLVEMGAGQGILANDILSYLQKYRRDFFASLEYVIVEKANRLIAQQKYILKDWEQLSWRTWEELPPAGIVGCFFSNELVDALPVHQIAIAQGKLQEVYVTLNSDSPIFTEVFAEPSTPQLAEYFRLIKVNFPSSAYADGYRTEVNLGAWQWLEQVTAKLQRGYLLTIDYGYPACRYYHPQRYQGTLQCYYQHRHHHNPYIYTGCQDITAHVDFTSLENYGTRCGWEFVGFTRQGLFLMALGMGDRLANLSQIADTGFQGVQQLLQRREALHQLIDPTGLGNFGVLIQSKGLTAGEQQQPLKGLQIPD
jgi:SAM-dependent MidA family methyltransferase